MLVRNLLGEKDWPVPWFLEDVCVQLWLVPWFRYECNDNYEENSTPPSHYHYSLLWLIFS